MPALDRSQIMRFVDPTKVQTGLVQFLAAQTKCKNTSKLKGATSQRQPSRDALHLSMPAAPAPGATLPPAGTTNYGHARRLALRVKSQASHFVVHNRLEHAAGDLTTHLQALR